jgi:hypothetical protein
MRRDHPKATPAVLREHWAQWTAIVSLFTRRRPARRRIDPRAYAALRKDLIAACQSLAEAEADAERRAYYRSLEETVRPWIGPRVLEKTDREMLSTLLKRCREVERELGHRRWRVVWSPDYGALPLFAIGTAAVGLAWAVVEFGRPLMLAARDVADTAWLTVKYAGGFYKVYLVGVLIVLGAIITIMRSVRPGP